MKRDYRRILMYGLVMFICVIVIVVMAFLSQEKIDGHQLEYQKVITENQDNIRVLEEKILTLEKENKSLQKQLTDVMSMRSDEATQSQIMRDLLDIYETYKSGDVEEAKKTFAKIEPMGFDDNALAYYELLKDYLEK